MLTRASAGEPGKDRRRRVQDGMARWRVFLRDTTGQDVIEYGLLSAFFGIVAIVAWVAIEGNLGAAYRAYDTGVQNLWQSPDPGGS